MKIISTSTTKPLSRLICWGSREKASHLAVVFDNEFVIHSNLFGVHPEWIENFLEDSFIVDEIDYDLTLIEEEEIWKSLLRPKRNKRGYDYVGLLYFMWHGLLYRLFNRPMPKKNLWGSEERYLCTEMVGSLPRWLGLPGDVDLGMVTPTKVMTILKSSYDSAMAQIEESRKSRELPKA